MSGYEEISIPFSVGTYDIDRARHVNNIVYIRWLEDLRNLFLRKYFDFDRKIEEGFYFVVVSTFIRYKRQLSLGDSPAGSVHLVANNKGVLLFGMTISLGDRTVAIAEQKCVLYDLKSSKMITER